jgi:hypothetical protein
MSTHDPLDGERYRNLFEGSQASLADMAARQAQALARVGRLRAAIVAVLRKNFMELSAQAEANLGGRLSEIDDEILLAYLDAFTAAASRGDQRATIQALKEAVMALGIPLRGDEPLVWVEQIHLRRQNNAEVGNAPGNAEKPSEEEPSGQHPGPSVILAETAPASRPLPVDDYWKWDDATPLSELFDDVTTGVTEGGIVDEPQRWGNELGAVVQGDEERWVPSPIAPSNADIERPVPTAATASESAETIDGTADRGPATTLAAADPTETPARTGRPRKTAKREPRRKAIAPAENAPDNDTSPVDAVIDDQPAQTPTKDADTASDLAALFDETPNGGAAGTTKTGPDAGHLVAPPMRPELFTPTGARKKRTARTKAVPVENLTLDEAAPDLVLNDGMRRALLAAASIPRPVFTRDLAGVAGSLAMVDAWEAECRADISNSPVRFVAPKSRHRLRGHLVAVEPVEVRPTDWWYQAVQRYRAGRLYELGVLLHRVGDEIVSFVLEEQVASFRLNTPRGLVGMVVLLDPRPVAGTAADLGAHLERLLSERLTMVAVLTASAEPGSLENLIAHIEQLAREGNWQPTAPVIAARSWEYADDRGTSAVMVLGQG